MKKEGLFRSFPSELYDAELLGEFLREARGDVEEASKLAEMPVSEFCSLMKVHKVELDYRGKVGDCFVSSARLVVQLYVRGIKAMLVHGFPVLNISPFTEYAHGWVELNGFCIDSEAKANFLMPDYYEIGRIDSERCVKYSAESILREINVSGHWGPWQKSFLEKTI